MKEIFISQYGNAFKIILTVDITKKSDYYILESKKFKLKIESTNDNLDEAKKEFSDVFILIMSRYINQGIVFKMLKFLNFSKQPFEQIMKNKKDELIENNKKEMKNIMALDEDEIMVTPFIEINRIEPKTQ